MAEPERLSPKDAAASLGISQKAIQQALARGAFPNVEREPKGKTVRVWIPREDVEHYRRTRRRPRTRQAPAASTAVAAFRTEELFQPQSRGLLRIALDVEENPQDTKRIAALLREVADLLEQ
jgi:hypothetical protein